MKTTHPASRVYGNMPRRTYASTREAFPDERFPAMFGPYRKPGPYINAVLWALSVVLLLAVVYAPPLLRLLGWSA